MLQSLGVRAVQVPKKADHLGVSDPSSLPCFWKLWNVPTGVGSIVAIAPYFGHVEHFRRQESVLLACVGMRFIR
jgi:hypothetical protein